MLTLTEQLIHSTIRIECIDSNGRESSGTGFFYRLFENGNNAVPVIVTNKHVIKGASIGFLHITESGPDSLPTFGSHERIQIDNFAQGWFGHPDPDVDLAIFLIGPLLHARRSMGKEPFCIMLGKSHAADNALLADLSAMEDIVMIGYPNGIWDSKNNVPIVRRGITATPPALDYEGSKQFMIDAACFPGSSGSPVFLLNLGSYRTRDGTIHMGQDRVALLGVLYAGPQHTAAGEIVVVNVPTDTRPIPISRIPNNLGLVIKVERLLEFEQALLNIGFRPPVITGAI